MNDIRIIDDKEARESLHIDDAIKATENVFLEYSMRKATNLIRKTIEFENGIYRTMSAAIRSKNLVGTKTGFWSSEFKGSSNTSTNSELITIYNAIDGGLLGIVNSHYLNQIRTAAIGALSVKYLSNSNSSIVGIIGTGRHARAQLIGASRVRNLEIVRVFSRSHSNRRKFCEEMSKELDIKIIEVDSLSKVLSESDIILEATTSTSPVVLGNHIIEGTHITSISSGYHGTRQIDDELIRKVSIICVDSIEQILQDGTGDIVAPVMNGLFSLDSIKELADVMSRKKQGRTSKRDITLFKSAGMAIVDLAVASLLFTDIK